MFALALLFAYLFLVAQYESWTLPLAILLSLGAAALGATALRNCERRLTRRFRG